MSIIENAIEQEFREFLQSVIGDLRAVEPKFLCLVHSLINEKTIPAEERIGLLNIFIDLVKRNNSKQT